VWIPPSLPPRAGCQPRVIDPFVRVVEEWLRSDITLKGSGIYERLVAEYGFGGHYQRVKSSWLRPGRGSRSSWLKAMRTC
jgi:hypothetical protein